MESRRYSETSQYNKGGQTQNYNNSQFHNKYTRDDTKNDTKINNFSSFHDVFRTNSAQNRQTNNNFRSATLIHPPQDIHYEDISY